MNRFQGKVAIVTGAGMGMGEATARRLVSEGARVACIDWNAEAVEAVAASLDDRAIAIHADVSKADQVEAFVARTVDHFGALHLAVNNAGVSGDACPTPDQTLDAWDRVIGVNLSGVFYGLKYQIPSILASGGGAIVNISSIFGNNALRAHAPYTASKYGVIGLTRTAALEYAEQPIRINSMCPGMVDTSMGNSGGAHTAAIVAMVPMKRMARAEEAAAVTCFLLSDEASFVTASEYAVDAGMLH